MELNLKEIFRKAVAVRYDVLKEPWNEYIIHDTKQVKLRSRLIITKMLRYQGEKGIDYLPGQRGIFTVEAPPEFRGDPTLVDTSLQIIEKEGLEKHTIDHMKYQIINEDWNEYILEDGTIFKSKLIVSDVIKTDLFTVDGDPLYWIISETLGHFISPKK